jgi:hypothetical protein
MPHRPDRWAGARRDHSAPGEPTPGATLQLTSSGRPLTVHSLGLLGKSEPSDLYFFICPLHRWVSCLRRILLGLGRSLSVEVRTPRHTGRTLEPRTRFLRPPNRAAGRCVGQPVTSPPAECVTPQTARHAGLAGLEAAAREDRIKNTKGLGPALQRRSFKAWRSGMRLSAAGTCIVQLNSWPPRKRICGAPFPA